MSDYKLLVPTSGPATPARPIAPRLAALSGTRAGFRQQWKQFDKFVDRLSMLFTERYSPRSTARVDGTFSTRQGPKLERWVKFQKDIDWALLGLGTCWGTAPWTVYDAIDLEQQGIPTVSVITDEFAGLARAVATAKGYPDLNILVVPHFFESMADEAVSDLADRHFAEVAGRIAQARP